MKRVLLIAILAIGTSAHARVFCEKAVSISSTSKLTADRKYSILKPEKTYAMSVSLINSQLDFSYEFAADQLPLVIEALRDQNHYQLCFDGDGREKDTLEMSLKRTN